jgi:hypothetical protein
MTMTAGEKAKAKYLKYKAYQIAYHKKRKENETPEQREKRLAYQREYQRKLREMRRRVINRPNNLTYAEEMELEQKKRERVNAAYAKKPKRERKKRNYFPKAQKVEPKKYPKVDPNNEKYRDVMRSAAKAYRALSPDEKLERIRIAYRGR